jgi:hypothetical protein
MLNKPKSKNIDLMTIVHFMLYIIFGYIYPNNYIIAFLIGILWEIFERIIVSNKVLYNLVKKYWIIPEVYWNENIVNTISDKVINMLGYLVGNIITYNRYV